MFYLNNNKNRPLETEDNKINDIIEVYNLNNIYYSLDNRNIFKRVDRYQQKIKLIILFGSLIIFNAFELIFNIVMLSILRRPSESFKKEERIATSFISLYYITINILLSTITV